MHKVALNLTSCLGCLKHTNRRAGAEQWGAVVFFLLQYRFPFLSWQREHEVLQMILVTSFFSHSSGTSRAALDAFLGMSSQQREWNSQKCWVYFRHTWGVSTQLLLKSLLTLCFGHPLRLLTHLTAFSETLNKHLLENTSQFSSFPWAPRL